MTATQKRRRRKGKQLKPLTKHKISQSFTMLYGKLDPKVKKTLIDFCLARNLYPEHSRSPHCLEAVERIPVRQNAQERKVLRNDKIQIYMENYYEIRVALHTPESQRKLYKAREGYVPTAPVQSVSITHTRSVRSSLGRFVRDKDGVLHILFS